MAVLPLLLLPDDRLRAVCAPVTVFDAALAQQGADMLDTMYAAPGRGLAGPQVGFMQRVFVMDATWTQGDPDPQVFVNPVITGVSADVDVATEGCLSIPDQPCDVARPVWVDLAWQDVTGVSHAQRFDGFAARCVQHEADHLDGILCIDKVVV